MKTPFFYQALTLFFVLATARVTRDTIITKEFEYGNLYDVRDIEIRSREASKRRRRLTRQEVWTKKPRSALFKLRDPQDRSYRECHITVNCHWTSNHCDIWVGGALKWLTLGILLLIKNSQPSSRRFQFLAAIISLFCKGCDITATPTSGREMEVVPVSELKIGSYPFTDRSYTFSSVGNYSESCSFIRGANNDKNTAPDLVQTSLEAPCASTIYLDFWGGSGHVDMVSSWIDDWTEASDATPTVFGNWGPGMVMKRDFDAGTVNLMGNNGQGHGTYYTFVCPRAISSCVADFNSLANLKTVTRTESSSRPCFWDYECSIYDEGASCS